MKDVIFFDYVDFIKKIIDWSIYIPILLVLLLVYLFTHLGFIRYPAGEYVLIGIFVSAFLSRKLFWGIFYFFQLRSFTTVLSYRINTEDDFRKVWSYYCRICHTDDLERMRTGGIYVKHYLLKLVLNHRLKSLQINQQTGGGIQDRFYQEDLMFYAFACQICNFTCSYDVLQHDAITSKVIEKPLSEISLEPIFIQIIKDCHNDGKGFLSTLALMLLIMIYLRLPSEKKARVVKFFTCLSDSQIGWLNRRAFEVAIATVMINDSPEEKLRELENELRNAKIERLEDKHNFRDKVLRGKISHLGLENAD